jgi:cobalt-zinc-cadmium efflux system outer membrane protein
MSVRFNKHTKALSILILALNHSTPVNAVENPASLPMEQPEKKIDQNTDLTLIQALQLTLHHNPTLAAMAAEIEAKSGLTLQAGLLPNPQFSANASNFGNSKFQGYDGDSITLGISQLIELGGKRAARSKAAQLDQELALRSYDNNRIKLLSQAAEAFIQLIAAQENLKLKQELLQLSQHVAHIADVQVQVGNVSPLQATKARISLSSAQIAVRQAQRELNNQRQKLASFWAAPSADFRLARGQLDNIQPLPQLSDLQQKLDDNPDIQRWLTEINKRRAAIDVEQSKAIPDITLNISGNNFIQENDYNLNAGFSMDIPVFNRNQGNIRFAEHKLKQAQSNYAAIENRIRTELKNTYQALKTAWQEINTLKQNVIPNAEKAFQAAQTGYEVGEFNFLTVLDAQRTLFSVKTQYLQVLTEYHLNQIRIEQLVGHVFTSPDENRSL